MAAAEHPEHDGSVAESELVLDEPKSVSDLLDVGERVLDDSTYIDAGHDARDQAETLLAAVLGCEVEELADGAADDHVPEARLRERYLAWVARRAAGEPIPLITGWAAFRGLQLRVKRGVFLPRPSSEFTVRRVLRRIGRRRSPVVVDLGTGSGAIAMAVASEVPAAQVWGTDISALGLGCARDNARRLGVGNVRFRQGDLFGALPRELAGGVDVIVGNIPYVLPEEIGMMPAEIVEYEPLDTLTDGSADGLDLLRRVAGEAPEWLASRGWLMLQVNEESGEEVAGLLDGFGYRTEVHGADDSWDVIVEARR